MQSTILKSVLLNTDLNMSHKVLWGMIYAIQPFEMTNSEIGAVIKMSTGRISQLITDLVEAGLITRQIIKDDQTNAIIRRTLKPLLPKEGK